MAKKHEKDPRTAIQTKQWICKDCKTDTFFTDDEKGDYYMVQFDLWNKYGVGYGMLCLDCFEKRLGRSLTIHDFIDCPVNDKNPRVQKLKRLYDETEVSTRSRYRFC